MNLVISKVVVSIMKESKRMIYVKALLNLFIAIMTILIIIFVIPKVLNFFMPFVIGWIIAMIANPIVKVLEKKVKILRKYSSAIIIIVTIALIITIIYYGTIILVREGIGFVQDLPVIYDELNKQIQTAYDSLDGIYGMLPHDFQGMVDFVGTEISEYVSDSLSSIKMPTISAAGSIAKNVAEIFFMTIITILSAYFFIAERDNLIDYIKKYTPGTIQDRYNMVVNSFVKAVVGYLKAQLKITFIMVAIIFIGLEILGVDYSFFLALAIAFIDLLPIFGTGAVFWPWALINALTGNYFRAIGIMVIYLLCQIIRQVLQPKLVGDSIGISPLMTLFFMFIGYRFMGILGMIIGLPVGMIIVSFYHAGIFDGMMHTMKMIVDDINEFRRIDKS